VEQKIFRLHDKMQVALITGVNLKIIQANYTTHLKDLFGSAGEAFGLYGIQQADRG